MRHRNIASPLPALSVLVYASTMPQPTRACPRVAEQALCASARRVSKHVTRESEQGAQGSSSCLQSARMAQSCAGSRLNPSCVPTSPASSACSYPRSASQSSRALSLRLQAHDVNVMKARALVHVRRDDVETSSASARTIARLHRRRHHVCDYAKHECEESMGETERESTEE